MSLVQVNFVSKKLFRSVTFQAIIPVEKVESTADGQTKGRLKTLYLLHGALGNHLDYLSGTRIQRWAEEKNLAVIMPAGENQFYVDKPEQREYYGRFVAEELVEFTRKMFPLSHKKEDTFIAGLSMGGYGALVNGLKYHETFSHIGAFSPAVFLKDLLSEDPSSAGSGVFDRGFYENVFGGLKTIEGSDKDYYHLIDESLKNKRALPKIYLPIGTEDFLLDAVRDFHEFLKERAVAITYIEDQGGHEWDFWDTYLKKFLDWLPLETKTASLNSGNVLGEA
ncbi:alpha/beta hydrolase [Enterococcus sp. LJL98]